MAPFTEIAIRAYRVGCTRAAVIRVIWCVVFRDDPILTVRKVGVKNESTFISQETTDFALLHLWQTRFPL